MKQDISQTRTQIDFGHDSIVVRKFINGILGGRMLDYAGFTASTILAGHAVITDGNGNYKPMPTKGDGYGTMPEGFKYIGVVYRSARVGEPVGIMIRGVVNKNIAPYYFGSDFNLADIILSCDLDDADPYQNYDTVTDPADLAGEAGKDIRVASDEVINAFGNNQPYFRNVLVTNAEVSQNITIKATEKLTLDNITVAGEQGDSNGKIIYAAKELHLQNIKAEENATLYNAFEGYQSTTDPDYHGIERLYAENLNIDCPSLKHNIINVYTPADGAEIVIKNSKFNLTVDNSNILRLANYLNAENVTVIFENIDWTYENSLTQQYWDYAGLAIYQPASSDVALSGDTSKLATWKFIIRNCRYNGVKVTENNFGEHSQAVYLYNVGGNNKVDNPDVVEGLQVVFE
jgi:hypothetical protein